MVPRFVGFLISCYCNNYVLIVNNRIKECSPQSLDRSGGIELNAFYRVQFCPKIKVANEMPGS